MKTSVWPVSMRTGMETTRARRGTRSRSWMAGASCSRSATRSSWAMVVWYSSESNSGVRIMAGYPRRARRAQPQHRQRASLEIVVITGAERAAALGGFPGARVEHELPPDARLVRRQHERDPFVVRVQQDQEGVIDDPVAHVVDLLDGVAGQPQPDAAAEPVRPVLAGHLLAVGAEPGQVLGAGILDAPSLEERAAVAHRMLERAPA